MYGRVNYVSRPQLGTNSSWLPQCHGAMGENGRWFPGGSWTAGPGRGQLADALEQVVCRGNGVNCGTVTGNKGETRRSEPPNPCQHQENARRNVLDADQRWGNRGGPAKRARSTIEMRRDAELDVLGDPGGTTGAGNGGINKLQGSSGACMGDDAEAAMRRGTRDTGHRYGGDAGHNNNSAVNDGRDGDWGGRATDEQTGAITGNHDGARAEKPGCNAKPRIIVCGRAGAGDVQESATSPSRGPIFVQRPYLAAATSQPPEPDAAHVDALIRERLAAIVPTSGTTFEKGIRDVVKKQVTKALHRGKDDRIWRALGPRIDTCIDATLKKALTNSNSPVLRMVQDRIKEELSERKLTMIAERHLEQVLGPDLVA